MALGNGAPDMFSAYAAITQAEDGEAGLAIGALFGRPECNWSGCFDSSIDLCIWSVNLTLYDMHLSLLPPADTPHPC